MITLQCKKCDNVFRLQENILTSVVCQKCGGNNFTFDGEYEFTSKDGEKLNTAGVFVSNNPHLYSIVGVAEKPVEKPIVKVFKEEEVKIKTPPVRRLRKKRVQIKK